MSPGLCAFINWVACILNVVAAATGSGDWRLINAAVAGITGAIATVYTVVAIESR